MADKYEVTERINLLLPGGSLNRQGWARDAMFLFSRASVPLVKRLSRLRERSGVCFGDDGMCLSLAIVDAGYVGVLLADYINIKTETVHSAVRVLPFTFGSLELPASPETGDVIIRAKETSFDILNTSAGMIVRCSMGAFDDVRPLYVNVTLTDMSCRGIYSAQAVGKGFSCEHTRVYSHASGTVHFGADETKLSGGFGYTEWRRSVLPYCSQHIGAVISGRAATGERIALSLGGGYGADDMRNVLTVDGEAVKLGEVNIGENGSVRSRCGAVELAYSELAASPREFAFPRLIGISREVQFGRCSGTVCANGRQYTLADAAAVMTKESVRG